MTSPSLQALETAIGYSFADRELLDRALCHSSFANESKGADQNNERQEFLGDAVLSIIVSDYIFRHLKVPEGELTKIRASLVCESALAGFANKIKLGSFLRLGPRRQGDRGCGRGASRQLPLYDRGGRRQCY